MLNLTIAAAKKNFFDTRRINSKLGTATEKALLKAGAYVRITAQRSMRKAPQKSISELTPEELLNYRSAYAKWKAGAKTAKKPKRPLRNAKPGDPPFYVTKLLREHIYFAHEKARNTTIVGPAKLNGKVSQTTAEALEKGGPSTTVRWTKVRGRWTKVRAIVQIRKHPYMVPALKKNQSKIAPLFKDKVK
jgi:hypothetical protein